MNLCAQVEENEYEALVAAWALSIWTVLWGFAVLSDLMGWYW